LAEEEGGWSVVEGKGMGRGDGEGWGGMMGSSTQ